MLAAVLFGLVVAAIVIGIEEDRAAARRQRLEREQYKRTWQRGEQ
jgi:hypothetical protein